jgi:hypothetical protein
MLRVTAQVQVNQRSHLLWSAWKQGKSWALLAAVQEKLPVRRVRDAIADIKERTSEGVTAEIRRRARALLKKINQAQNAIGRGNVEILSPGKKIKSKRLSVSNSRALHRLLDKHKLQAPFYGDSEKTAESIAVDFLEKGRIQNRGRREKIAKKFLKRVKQQENLR